VDGSHGPGEEIEAPWSAVCLGLLLQHCDDKAAGAPPTPCAPGPMRRAVACRGPQKRLSSAGRDSPAAPHRSLLCPHHQAPQPLYMPDCVPAAVRARALSNLAESLEVFRALLAASVGGAGYSGEEDDDDGGGVSGGGGGAGSRDVRNIAEGFLLALCGGHVLSMQVCIGGEGRGWERAHGGACAGG